MEVKIMTEFINGNLTREQRIELMKQLLIVSEHFPQEKIHNLYGVHSDIFRIKGTKRLFG
jgi:hypothetical protein